MLTPSHIIAGQAAYLSASLATGHTPAMLEGWAAAASALLPDLDKRSGIIGRLFPYISGPLEFRFGHRTLTHSLLVQVILGLGLYFLLPFGWFLAIITGVVSHTVADMMTPGGVAWFWPSRARCVLPGNERYRMRQMGWGELSFSAIMAILAFPLLSLAQAGQGTGGLIKAAIGDIAAAREQYDAGKGANAWTLRIKGRDNQSYADVSGEYPVIGPWGESGFILEAEASSVTACKAMSCDWYSDHAVLVKGAQELTAARRIKVQAITMESLLAQLEPLSEAGRVFLSGSFKAHGLKGSPPSIKVTAEKVSLYYAEPDMLASHSDLRLRDVDLLVQVRHAPGVEVADVAVQGDQDVGRSRHIRRWLQ